MSSSKTNRPIHEVILQIMYFENTERAVEMSPADILWRIDNPEISERYVTEVLDWMVRQQMVTQYLGKYTLDRIEFLKQKEIYSLVKELSPHKNREQPAQKPPRSTFFITAPATKAELKKRKRINMALYGLFATLILTLGYITYTLSGYMNVVNGMPEVINIGANTASGTESKIRKLYTSSSREYDETARNAIRYSFVRQNNINKETAEKILSLGSRSDSLHFVQEKQLFDIMRQVEDLGTTHNDFANKVLICNVIIVMAAISLLVIFLIRRW